jgi:AcrR family transcriptional regulator
VTEIRDIPLRRIPQQVRGQQRIHKILNAAEQVFATSGYDNATTNAIAARAETSIGSLYQFFPNKEAILKAVVLRYLEEMHSLFDQNLSQEAAETLPLAEFLERLIHGLAQLHESHAGFRPLFFVKQASHEVAEATDTLHSESMGRIDALLALRAPDLSLQQRQICSRTCVAVFQSLMFLAMDLQGDERALQLHEMRTVLLTYLRTYLPEHMSK